MAALTATRIGRRKPWGDRFVQMYQFTIANANAADEWIVTDFKHIEGVLGIVPFGTADIAEIPSVVLNADGTGVTAGDDPGHLGIEGNAAVWQVTVVGKI